MKRQDKEWMAYVHEAAHAGAALHYELGLEHILIRRPGFLSSYPSGETQLSDYGVTDEELAENPHAILQTEPAARLVVALVGQAAQYRAIVERGYSRWTAAWEARSCSGGDRELAAKIVRYSPWSWKKAQQEADNLVDYYWAAINHLAEQLMLAGGYLGGDVAADVFHEAVLV